MITHSGTDSARMKNPRNSANRHTQLFIRVAAGPQRIFAARSAALSVVPMPVCSEEIAAVYMHNRVVGVQCELSRHTGFKLKASFCLH